MYPAEFDYVAPTSVEEALDVLSATPGAKVLAGGHSLVPLMKLRLLAPPLLVDIGRIDELVGIREEEDSVVIGAMTTHAAVAGSPVIRSRLPGLAEAASWVGDPQVRNRGTLCGSLAHADPASDEPAVAIALGATLVARSANGSREIPATDFFVDTLTSALEPEEMVVEARFPIPGPGEGSAYDKLGRRGGRSDFAVAGAAAWLRVEGGVVAEARVALTGVGVKPAPAGGIADALAGGASIAEAAQRATDGLTVLADLFGSEDYKAHLARVYAERALTVARERAGG